MNFRKKLNAIFALALISTKIFALTELEKTLDKNFLSNLKPITVEKVDRLLAACRADIKSNQKLTQKEQDICKSFFKAEYLVKQAYKHLLDSCAYSKLADLIGLNAPIYDQMFVDFLLKNNAINLARRQDPESIRKLTEYKNRFLKEVTKKEKPYFVRICSKEISFKKLRQKGLDSVKLP